MRELENVGARITFPWLSTFEARAYGQSGNPLAALAIIDKSLNDIEKTGERESEAELHRLRGEMLLLQPFDQSENVESCFRKAIEIARRQGAKAWELRATMSLSRLLANHGRRDEALLMPAEIYIWFTEGFDTADLKDAKALLDELSAG
jgi:predicted ATPase